MCEREGEQKKEEWKMETRRDRKGERRPKEARVERSGVGKDVVRKRRRTEERREENGDQKIDEGKMETRR